MQTSLDHELETCKFHVPCSECRHKTNCPCSSNYNGYCIKKTLCITLKEVPTYCYGCPDFSDKCWTFGYSAPDPSNPDTPAPKTEFQKMLEFFFPKKKMRKETTSDEDPWEFL